jgi:outer membrane protein assembly factor BamB
MSKKYLILLFLFLFSCKSKKDIAGDRIPIFAVDNTIIVDAKEEIKINDTLATYTDYYGDSSPLNKKIENFKIENLKPQKSYFSNIAIVDKTLYYIDKNGKFNGQKKVFDRVFKIKLSYSDDIIYAISGTNTVVAVEKDGNLKWNKNINSIPISTPIADAENLYLITNDNKTYCLNNKDGTIKWVHYGSNKNTKILGVANPVIYENYVIVAYSSGDLFVLNKKTGEMVQNFNLVNRGYLGSAFDLTDLDSTPIIKGKTLIASANNGSTIAVDLQTMKILWKKSVSTLANIVVNGDFLYMINTDNILVAMSLKDGKIVWYLGLGSEFLYKSMMFANGEIYVFSEKNYKIITPKGEEKSTVKGKLKLYSNNPISVEGVLYGVGE